MSKQSLSKLMKPGHLQVVRSLGYALTLGNYAAWAGYSVVLAARLTPTERAALAFMALKSLGYDDAVKTVEAVFDAPEQGEVAA